MAEKLPLTEAELTNCARMVQYAGLAQGHMSQLLAEVESFREGRSRIAELEGQLAEALETLRKLWQDADMLMPNEDSTDEAFEVLKSHLPVERHPLSRRTTCPSQKDETEAALRALGTSYASALAWLHVQGKRMPGTDAGDEQWNNDPTAYELEFDYETDARYKWPRRQDLMLTVIREALARVKEASNG